MSDTGRQRKQWTKALESERVQEERARNRRARRARRVTVWILLALEMGGMGCLLPRLALTVALVGPVLQPGVRLALDCGQGAQLING